MVDQVLGAPGTPSCVTPTPVQAGCGDRVRVAFMSTMAVNGFGVGFLGGNFGLDICIS
jgi:hypothetical protein